MWSASSVVKPVPVMMERAWNRAASLERPVSMNARVAIRVTRIEMATTESRMRSAATATGETEMEPKCGFTSPVRLTAQAGVTARVRRERDRDGIPRRRTDGAVLQGPNVSVSIPKVFEDRQLPRPLSLLHSGDRIEGLGKNPQRLSQNFNT
jgi:hypothetical protein